MSDDEFEDDDVELDEAAPRRGRARGRRARSTKTSSSPTTTWSVVLDENRRRRRGRGSRSRRPSPRRQGRAAKPTRKRNVLDLDEELHPDDVEAPLDALLQERTASATLEDEEEEVEEEEAEVDERGEVPTKIVPRRPGEFLCSSCFLVLPRNQLADEKRMLCRDCA